MASRFTDTSKWGDTWFCELSPHSKLLFMYLCDQCDVAGFIEINIRKICFDTGISKKDAETSLNDIDSRVIYSLDKRFLYIINFLKHQKNTSLNESNNAHKGIIKRLNDNLLVFGFKDINQFFISPSLAPNEPLTRGTGNGIGNNIGNGNNKTMCENKKNEISTWKKSFEIYKNELRIEYDKLINNLDWIAKQERYHPNVDIKLSLEKACVGYWALEVGWKKKKASKTDIIDWEATFRNALDLSSNKVYKQNNAKQKEIPTATTYVIPE